MISIYRCRYYALRHILNKINCRYLNCRYLTSETLVPKTILFSLSALDISKQLLIDYILSDLDFIIYD